MIYNETYHIDFAADGAAKATQVNSDRTNIVGDCTAGGCTGGGSSGDGGCHCTGGDGSLDNRLGKQMERRPEV